MTKDEDILLKDKYKNEAGGAFMQDCVRLRNGEPLAYVIGWMPFLHATIHLDSRPLIPRVETEFWVEKAITEIRNTKKPTVLDLCAGSGCIGVSVLQEISEALVDLVEVDEKHHTTIEKNVLLNVENTERSRVLGGDLFEKVEKRYDFILTNPPYIDEASERVGASVKEYEPGLALYGGEHGMRLVEKILRTACEHLTEKGVLYIEHEPEQVPRIATISEEAGLVGASLPDQYGVLRYSRFSVAEGK